MINPIFFQYTQIVLSWVFAGLFFIEVVALLYKKFQWSDIARLIANSMGLLWIIGCLILMIWFRHRSTGLLLLLLAGGILSCLNLIRLVPRMRRRKMGLPARSRNPVLDICITALSLIMLWVYFFRLPTGTINSGVTTNNLPVWKPQPAVLNSLSPEVHINGYSVRPPQGLIMTRTKLQAKEAVRNFYIWKGTKRADKTRSIFAIEISYPQPGYNTDMDIATVLKKTAARDGSRHMNFISSTTTLGNVQGVPFSRLYWIGFWSPTRSQNHGLIYLTSNPQAVITIRRTDAEPYSKLTLPDLEAAALTFRRL